MHLVLHGGRFVSRDSADFLFSTNADCEDTKLVHKEVPTLVVFHPEWIVRVVRARCHPKDHGCGPYYICPASMRGTQVEALSFNPLHPPPSPIATTTTMNKNEASDAHTPVESHHCFAEQKPGRDVTPTDGEEDEESLHMLSTQHFNTQGIFLVILVLLMNSITFVRPNSKPRVGHIKNLCTCIILDNRYVTSRCKNAQTLCYILFPT